MSPHATSPPAPYPPDTAGGIMDRRITAVHTTTTVGEAIEVIRRHPDEAAHGSHVYTVAADGRLAGIVAMRDLVLSPPHVPLARLLVREPITVAATTDSEVAARLMERYDLPALPVVDADRRLLGVVTIDRAMAVLAEATTEDVQRLFGAGAGERLDSPWHYSFRRRVGWLVANLGLASASAAVIGAFESTLRAMIVLTVYLPVVAGMGGNASAQAMAVMIRGLAVGRVDWRLFRRVLAREFRVGLATGCVVGLLAGAVARTLHPEQGWGFGLLVAVALIANQTVGCLWGATIPYLMGKLGQDPAQSATIFTTTMTDLLGFLLLLGLASAWLR